MKGDAGRGKLYWKCMGGKEGMDRDGCKGREGREGRLLWECMGDWPVGTKLYGNAWEERKG